MFQNCLFIASITFIVTLIILSGIHIWLYFKLVAIAKQKGGGKNMPPGAKLKHIIKDPYPGLKHLHEVREEEIWKLYLVEKSKSDRNYPLEPKYFNLLSTKFLQSKGLNQPQIKKLRNQGINLNKCSI